MVLKTRRIQKHTPTLWIRRVVKDRSERIRQKIANRYISRLDERKSQFYNVYLSHAEIESINTDQSSTMHIVDREELIVFAESLGNTLQCTCQKKGTGVCSVNLKVVEQGKFDL